MRDYQRRDGIMYLRVEGKGDKIRFLPVSIEAQLRIAEYLESAGHGEDLKGPLFRPVKNNATGTLAKPLHPASVYREIEAVLRQAGGDYSRRARLLRA
ncbi:MAG: hypothetical protein HY268_12400 [Deltaproteobacteria bacterium]|nr:hypothetical protein [Deltaproteobacteria bacterium]